MLVLSRKKSEEIVLTPTPAVALRDWLQGLPIDQEQRREGLLLIEELESLETRLMVIEIRFDKVRLGIDAPRDRVTVHRLEIQQQIDAEGSQAVERLLQPA